MILIDDQQMVVVDWEDSEMTEGWKTKPELLEYLNDPIPVIKSVGWMLLDGEKYIVIAQSIDPEHSSGFIASDLIKIPKALVKRVAKLKAYACGGKVQAGELVITPGFGKHEKVYDADGNIFEIREIERHPGFPFDEHVDKTDGVGSGGLFVSPMPPPEQD